MANKAQIRRACREAQGVAYWLPFVGDVRTFWWEFSDCDILTGGYRFGPEHGHFILKSEAVWELDAMDRCVLAVASNHNMDIPHIRRCTDGKDEVIRQYRSHYPEASFPTRDGVLRVTTVWRIFLVNATESTLALRPLFLQWRSFLVLLPSNLETSCPSSSFMFCIAINCEFDFHCITCWAILMSRPV